MNYGKKSFTVAVGGEQYRDNWDRIFGGESEDLRCLVCGDRDDLINVDSKQPLCRDFHACVTRAAEDGQP
jgi:hypothetical protein